MLWAKLAWQWGAGSFMHVKELMGEETIGQGNIGEREDQLQTSYLS